MQLAKPTVKPGSVRSQDERKKIYDFLGSHPSGVLCTVDPNNNPHATVIYYHIDESFATTFVTKRGTKKHDCLQHNHRIMLTVFEPTSQTTAQITGVASEIVDDAALNRAFRKTMLSSVKTANGALPPIAKIKAGEFVAYQVEPSEICMTQFAATKHSSGKNFETYKINF